MSLKGFSNLHYLYNSFVKYIRQKVKLFFKVNKRTKSFSRCSAGPSRSACQADFHPSLGEDGHS